MWLFLIFVAVPILEIALFIQVGGFLGLWPTLLIVVITALVGTWVMRVQGLGVLGRLQQSLGGSENPATPLAHGALILVAGVLLLTPGFFTDALGFSLLIPPVRDALIRLGAERFASNISFQASGMAGTRRDAGSETVVDGAFTVLDENTDRSNSAQDDPEPTFK